MEDQLANSSCLVGSLDRFLDIAENQNSSSSPPMPMCAPRTLSTTPERKTALKRRSTTAKLRLSQINRESVSIIEERVHQREQSVRKIQRVCRAFYDRLQTHKENIIRSKNLVHYHVLTHLLTVKHAKKCRGVRTVQQWWRFQSRRYRAARHLKYTQQGRWSLRQAQLIQALCQGYRIRRVLRNPNAHTIKTAIMLISNANEVLEGICGDINSDPLVYHSILSLEPHRVMTTRLLIYMCLHRSDFSDAPRKRNSTKKKQDPSLQEDFFVYRRVFSQVHVEWAFVDNFVRQILHNRAIVSNFFANLGHGQPLSISVSSPRVNSGNKIICHPPTVHSPHTKENRKLDSNYTNTHAAAKVRSRDRDRNRNDATSSHCQADKNPTRNKSSAGTGGVGGENADQKKPLVPQSLLSLMADSPSTSLQQKQHQYQQSHGHDDMWQQQPRANIAISPVSAPLSLVRTLPPSPLPDKSSDTGVQDKDSRTEEDSDSEVPAAAYCLSPKRSSRVIPASLCSPPSGAISNSSVQDSRLHMSFNNHAALHISPRQSLPIPHCPLSRSQPHLQIDIMCAQHLPPTPAARKSRNLAARRPGLKVTVSLPVMVGGGGQEGGQEQVGEQEHALKVVHTATYVSPHDEQVSPTNPVWNFTTYCPLRPPPSAPSVFVEDDAPGGGGRGGRDYDTAIFSYWSLGTVKIEVIDSERFNEDIFIGEVTLFLSSFLLPGGGRGHNPLPRAPPSAPSSASSSYTCKEISGTFSLNNNAANGATSVSTSCTSGVRGGGAKITAAVYLHLPIHHSSNMTTHTVAGNTITESSSSPSTPQAHRDMKSALAHIPSPCSGGRPLTASARRQQRLSASCSSSAPPPDDSFVPLESSTHLHPLPGAGAGTASSLLSATLHTSSPPSSSSTNVSKVTSSRAPHTRSASVSVVSTGGQGLGQGKADGVGGGGGRRKSLESVGCILDFLQGALREEAEATMESLKQNLASSKKKEQQQGMESHSSSLQSLSSREEDIVEPLPKQDTKAAASSRVGCVGVELDLVAVQNDVDDILGALQHLGVGHRRGSTRGAQGGT